MSDRRRREERQRSRSRSRDRDQSRERHGSHHRSGGERYTPPTYSPRHSRGGSRSSLYPPPRGQYGHGAGMPGAGGSGGYGTGLYYPPPPFPPSRVSYPGAYGSGLSQAGLPLRPPLLPNPTVSSQARLPGPPLPFPAMVSYPRVYGAGSSQAGLHTRPPLLPTPPVSHPADHGAGSSRAGLNPAQVFFSDDYFGLTVAPGTKMVPLKNVLGVAKAAFEGTARQETNVIIERVKDERVLPYMTEDMFTNYVKLNVPGIGTLLFFYHRPLITNDLIYLDRWHLFVKVRETGPDTGPGSANNGYAYVATIHLSHTLGQDQRLEFQRRFYYFQHTINDIKPHLADAAELILWYQARHNFSVAKEFVDFIPTLWEQPVHKPDERWFTKQNWGINAFLRKKGISLDRIEELYEQRKAIQSTLGLPEQMTAPTHSEQEEEEQAQDAEMDQFLLDIFRQNQE